MLDVCFVVGDKKREIRNLCSNRANKFFFQRFDKVNGERRCAAKTGPLKSDKNFTHEIDYITFTRAFKCNFCEVSNLLRNKVFKLNSDGME